MLAGARSHIALVSGRKRQASAWYLATSLSLQTERDDFDIYEKKWDQEPQAEILSPSRCLLNVDVLRILEPLG